MFSGTFKDIFTNIIAFFMLVVGAIQTYLQGVGDGEINWLTAAFTVFGAIVAWFTGKDSKGNAKQP